MRVGLSNSALYLECSHRVKCCLSVYQLISTPRLVLCAEGLLFMFLVVQFRQNFVRDAISVILTLCDRHKPPPQAKLFNEISLKMQSSSSLTNFGPYVWHIVRHSLVIVEINYTGCTESVDFFLNSLPSLAGSRHAPMCCPLVCCVRSICFEFPSKADQAFIYSRVGRLILDSSGIIKTHFSYIFRITSGFRRQNFIRL